jgi:hypothetical protein
VTFFFLAFALAPEASGAERRRITRAQYRKNLRYNKNALPEAWRYEASYTLWRLEHGLPANRHSYRRYKADKRWRVDMYRDRPLEAWGLNTLDWTAEELALFLRDYQDLFKFHPAGIEGNY